MDEKNPTAVFPGEQFGGSSLLLSPNRLQTVEEEGGKGAFLSSFPFSSPPGAIFSLLLLSHEGRGGERGRKMPSLLTPPPLGFPKEAGGRYDMERKRKGREKRTSYSKLSGRKPMAKTGISEQIYMGNI